MIPEAFRNAWRLMRIPSWMQFENKSVREWHPWLGRWVACSQKYLPLSLELNHWIIYYSTNLNVKWLGQPATEGESSTAAALIANITSRISFQFVFFFFSKWSRGLGRCPQQWRESCICNAVRSRGLMEWKAGHGPQVIYVILWALTD